MASTYTILTRKKANSGAFKDQRLVFKLRTLCRREQAKAKARNQKGRIVSKDLQQGHRKWVEDVTNPGTTGLWRLAKWARTRGQAYDQGTIPTLEVEEENGTKTFYKTSEEKARIFQKIFIPEPPPTDLSDIPDAEYPQDIKFPAIKGRNGAGSQKGTGR
jgi:hypothetical protein